MTDKRLAKEAQFKVVGKSVPIIDAHKRIQGRAKYTEDMSTELFVKILTSPHAHAMIKSIDISQAEKINGVEAVLSYKNVPEKMIKFAAHRQCLMMDQHLRYVGDYVAAVAATSVALAEDAIEKIQVEYEILEAVFDPEEALKDGAPKIFEEGNYYGDAEGLPFWAEYPDGTQSWGDIDKGFSEADIVIEDDCKIGSQGHAPMETIVCMAEFDGNEATLWTSTQTPTEMKIMFADFFGLAASKVIVKSEFIGGGFGGKSTGRYQYITALLSKMTGGRKTRWNMTREETAGYTRRPWGNLYTKIGAKKDGTFTAIDFKGYYDIGAYGNHQGGSTAFHGEAGIISYKIPHARYEGVDVHTNHFRTSNMRAVHVPFVAFAIESVVEQLALKLDMDPIEIRLKNMPKSGDLMPPSEYIRNAGAYPTEKLDIYPAKEMMQKVLNKIDWKNKFKGIGIPTSTVGSKRRAVGIAYSSGYCGFTFDSVIRVNVQINIDGSATVFAASQEIGQGINTTLCQIAAEALGLPLESVSIVTSDTRNGAYDAIGARGSNQLSTNGHLLLRAIKDVKEKVCAQVGPFLGVEPEEVVFTGGKCHIKGSPEEEMSFEDIFTNMMSPFLGTATGEPLSMEPPVKEGYKAKQPMVTASEIEIDIETGEITPIKIVIGMFPGKMINEGIVRGQAIGAAVQSLGMALWEEIKFDTAKQKYLSNNFTEYRLPRALDIPIIETVLIEEVDLDSPEHEGLPFGARAVGEMGAWGVPVSIANAVYNATGVRIRKSPMTAENVWKALNGENSI